MLTLADVFEALTSRRPAGWEAHGITSWHVDSRQCRPGAAFVALPGEQTDGHRHIEDALSRGAQVVLAERTRLLEPPAAALIEVGGELPAELRLPVVLLTASSLRAFQDIAAWWRRRFQMQVIGVTGSVGKTVTKETIAEVLSQRFRTYKSAGNLNSESGLPLALLTMEHGPERAVFEMGMYDIGEIARLAEIAQPRIGVVTNVGLSHVERLGSIERIAEAKSELPRALPPDGWAVLNGDDARVLAMRDLTKAQVYTYGLEPTNNLWASDVEGLGLQGMRFWLHNGSKTPLHVTVPLLGRHSVHTALAAAAVGRVEGMAWEDIVNGLHNVSGQLRLATAEGVNGATIIDDTYNASPVSCIAALNLLSELEGRKIAVLADMLELGDHEQEAHELVGRRAAEVADIVVAVGRRAEVLGRCAIDEGMDPSRVHFCADKPAAVALLRELMQPGDMVLVKGSRGMAMEDVVAQITVHQHHAH